MNIPLGESAAIRLVGWARHDGGYIDNVASTRTFPTSGISMNSLAEENYNEADTYGARAALKIDLSDSWSITPTVMAQKTNGMASTRVTSNFGDLEVAHSHPEGSEDQWMQAALTVEGKFSNFDITFTGSYLKRDVDTESDYSDYAFFYDTLYGSGASFYDNDGELINPSQFIQGKDGYTKTSGELRISSPSENRVRFIGGLFYQRQTHDIQQEYNVTGLADQSDVTGWDDSFWLTKQWRVDRDYAVYRRSHVRCHRSAVADGRHALLQVREFARGILRLRHHESVRFEHRRGIVLRHWPGFRNRALHEPRQDGRRTRTTRTSINASFQATDDVMFYATVSEGFRPGGVNRRGTFPPYKADFLTNYEIGWKTSWAGQSSAFQRRYLRRRLGRLPVLVPRRKRPHQRHERGQGRMQGVEVDLQWMATDSLTIYGGFAVQKAELAEDFCKSMDPLNGDPFLPDVASRTIRTISRRTGSACRPRPSSRRISRRATSSRSAGSTRILQGSLVHNGDSTVRAVAVRSGRARHAGCVYAVRPLVRHREGELERGAVRRQRVSTSARACTDMPNAMCRSAWRPELGGNVYSVMTRPRTIGLKFSQKF